MCTMCTMCTRYVPDVSSGTPGTHMVQVYHVPGMYHEMRLDIWTTPQNGIPPVGAVGANWRVLLFHSHATSVPVQPGQVAGGEGAQVSQGSQGHKKNVHYLCMGGDTEDDSTADLQQKVLASDELDEYEEGEGGECLQDDR